MKFEDYVDAMNTPKVCVMCPHVSNNVLENSMIVIRNKSIECRPVGLLLCKECRKKIEPIFKKEKIDEG